MMTIIEDINQKIKDAIRSKEQIKLDTLRMLKSLILAVDARGNLPDAEVIKLFKTYYGNLQEAFAQAVTATRPEIAEKLKKEIEIVQGFLPKALSHEETKKIIMQAIAESGAKTKKDLGLVMKAAMKMNNAIEGKVAKEVASELLPD